MAKGASGEQKRSVGANSVRPWPLAVRIAQKSVDTLKRRAHNVRPYGCCTRKVSEFVSESGGLKMAKGASGEQKALRRGEQCSPAVVCRAHDIKMR